jgi:hypothetical protein
MRSPVRSPFSVVALACLLSPLWACHAPEPEKVTIAALPFISTAPIFLAK